MRGVSVEASRGWGDMRALRKAGLRCLWVWRAIKRQEAKRPSSNYSQIAQNIITGSTLVLAVCAYLSWKDQEAAKRKADVAATIMRQLHELANCLRASPHLIGGELNMAGVSSLAEDSLTVFEKCDEYLATLSFNVNYALAVLDAHTSEALERTRRQVHGRRLNLRHLKALADRSMERSFSAEEEATRKRHVNEELQKLYPEYSSVTDHSFSPFIFRTSRLPTGVAAEVENATTSLRPYLNFEQKPGTPPKNQEKKVYTGK